MDSLKGKGDALLHPTESSQTDPSQDVDRKKKKISRSKMKTVTGDSEEERRGSKVTQGLPKLNSKAETMWGDDVLHSTAPKKDGQTSTDKKRFEFQPDPTLMTSEKKKNDHQQVPSTSRNTTEIIEGSKENEREGEHSKVCGDEVLHATGRNASGSFQTDPVLPPKTKDAVSGKKKDPEAATINLSRVKKILKGFEDEMLKSKVNKGSSKMDSRSKTIGGRGGVLHGNRRSEATSNKETAEPETDFIPLLKGEKEKCMDRQFPSSSRIRKRNLEEDSEEEGSKAIRASSKLHELIPNFPLVWRGDCVLHSTEYSAASSDKNSTEAKVEDLDSRIKKNNSQVPSTSRAKKRKLEEVSEEKQQEGEGSNVRQGPPKLKAKPQKRSLNIECKVEGCRHVARISHGAAVHQALHEKGYLLRCTECDHLFAERPVATKHVRHEHDSNDYGKYLVGPPGTDLAVPNTDGLYSCIQCPYITPHMHHMNNHTDAHLQGLTLRCEICYNLFSSVNSLTAHKSHRHPEMNGDFCSEPSCSHKFRNTRSRHVHIEVHKNGWHYRCTLCHEIFGCKGRTSAGRHCRQFHEGQPVSIIEVKDGVLPLQELLKERILSRKSLSCDECNYQTTTDAALRGHLGRHRNGFQFACKQCHQLFKTERLQMKHFKADHNQNMNFACNEEGCLFKTTDTARYRRHKTAHRKGWVRQCGICNDVFAGYRVAHFHVQAEHPDSPLTVLRNALHIPVLKKDGDAPHRYKCHYCNSTFQSTESILVHLRAVHKKTSEELVGLKLEAYEPKILSQDQGGCPYQQPLPVIRTFRSKYCFYANNSKSSVRSHNKIFHETELNNEPPSRLPKSEAQKAQKAHLKKICGIVGCSFETPYTTWMRRHICGHGAGYPFECNLCHNVFAAYSDARSHVTNTHTREFDVTSISIKPREEVLKFMFASRKQHQSDELLRIGRFRTISMQTHMDVLRKKMLRRLLRDPLYSGIVVSNVYKCPRCSFKSNYLSEMLLHRSKKKCSKKLETQLEQARRAAERREKMYGCTYHHCQYQTDSSIAYRNHYSKHSIRTPVKCNICSDIFESVAKCSQHSRAAHPKFVNTTRKALIFREPLEDLVCTVCKPYDEFYHSTCFLLHTAMDHPEILPIEGGRIMTTFDADEFQDRRPPLPLREVDFNKKTSLVPADWMQVELDPLEFNYPCDQCDEMFYHPTCVDLHQKMAHRKQK